MNSKQPLPPRTMRKKRNRAPSKNKRKRKKKTIQSPQILKYLEITVNEIKSPLRGCNSKQNIIRNFWPNLNDLNETPLIVKSTVKIGSPN